MDDLIPPCQKQGFWTWHNLWIATNFVVLIVGWMTVTKHIWYVIKLLEGK